MSEFIYTATFGKVELHKLINKTPKGFRVKSGKWDRDGVVFNLKQYSGWYNKGNKIYYQQRAFTKKSRAECFALEQLLSMEGFYSDKLSEILKLKTKLENKDNN